MISDEDKEKVRQATDFVALVGETVELRQRGQEFWGCCPFHGEKSPSFKVNPNTGLWHCFGCSDGGDVFNYVQRRENLEFPDAIRYLADRCGIELSEERGGNRGPRKNRLVECLTETEAFYSTMLMRGRGEGPDKARAYFAGRGFGGDVCRRWGLGYAPGRGTLVKHLREKGFTPAEMIAADVAVDRNGRPSDRFYERVMFPIRDERGNAIAFGGRVIGPKKETAKYVNTRDTAVFNKGKHLFAYDRAKETMAATGVAIVCEGYTDVIAMHEAGFTNAVAALGTAFRLDHIKLMERQRVSKIICMFDGDAAGQRAAERAVRYIDKTSAALVCVVLPNNQDPMEFLVDHGADALRPILDAAQPLMDFVFSKRLADYDLSVPGLRVKALEDMAGMLAPLKHSVLLNEYATRLADTLGFEVEDCKRAIKDAPVESDPDERPARRSSGNSSARTNSAPSRSSQPQPFANDDDEPDYGDYLPHEAYEESPADYGAAAPQPSLSLSADDRMQLSSELELLAIMAADPDSVRPYGERLADIWWADKSHEAIAWAILSTPEGTAPADAVAAAATVEPRAPQVLSGGRVVSEQGMGEDEKLSVVVDTVELCSCRRRVREIRARLKRASGALDANAEELFSEATELQRRANELVGKLAASHQS